MTRGTAVLLVTVAAAGVALGFWSIRNQIVQGVQRQDIAETQDTTSADGDGEQLAALREQDTDRDSLSDYDELYVHDTSPYLPDSDSDGTSDADEIRNSTDPNCPEGTECRAVRDTTPSTGNGTEVGALTIDGLRQALISAGAPEHLVNNVSDEELVQLYTETIGQTSSTNADTNATPIPDQVGGSGTNAGTTAPPATTSGETLDAAELRAFTPDQIREFLSAAGVDETTLSQVDNATLQAIFQEALNQEGL
ncbi:MAG: hypothetical protein HY341_01915 [Candidatus Kerfeldbacteria bacterium]|nr:hypothetical protein [Candidatus Kerfeldbacteria bacterium]